MKTIEEKIAIYRAYLNGEQIQWQSKSSKKDWEDIKAPSFNYETCDYRVKPCQQEMKVAYAFVSAKGSLEWNVDERFCSPGFVRHPEFDIIASSKGQE